jgi:D-glycero-D-manno-heptose 1,7-bisphosphate phosphatase
VNLGAIFLDRDGTLNELVADPLTGRPESPLRTEDVRLIPGAALAARSLIDAGWRLIGVTNQPAAAKGTVTMGELDAVQARVLQLLGAAGVSFEDFRICHHHPDGNSAALSVTCDCRKPKPGMLVAAAASHHLDLGCSWMIGDTDADVLAGTAAGCRTVLLENPGSSHKRSAAVVATFTAPDLAAAVDILDSGRW